MLIGLGFLRSYNNMNLHSFPRIWITASKTFSFNSFLAVCCSKGLALYRRCFYIFINFLTAWYDKLSREIKVTDQLLWNSSGNWHSARVLALKIWRWRLKLVQVKPCLASFTWILVFRVERYFAKVARNLNWRKTSLSSLRHRVKISWKASSIFYVEF